MTDFAVLYDACVLYPAPLRDLLMRLALTDLFRAKWTNQIHDEWIRNVIADRPDLSAEFLERTRDLMNIHVRDGLVDGYKKLEKLKELQALPDPNDKHVLAAAIHSKCLRIITFNLRDFPAAILNQFNIEAQHPDEFIVETIDAAPDVVCAVAQQHRLALKNPPKSVDEYLATLRQQKLLQTVTRLEAMRESL
jgi:hypothetical protein